MRQYSTQLALLLLAASLTVSGCSRMPSLFGGDKTSRAAPPPMTSVMNDSAMQSSRGVNTGLLFSENIRSDKARLDRLEDAVQAMRNEFNVVRPSIDRLVVIEEDIQNLISQLEMIANSEPQPAPPVAVIPAQAPPTMAKAVPQAQKMKAKATPPVTNGTPSIYGIRVGEHPGKTRIVMDSNAAVSFTADLDSAENILVLDIPNANWTAAMSKSFSKSPFLGSYSVQNKEGGGVMFVAQLKKSARIAYKDTLNALSGSGKRLVIDIAN